jgi:hypothetical protein
MKKILLVLSILVAVVGLALVATPKAHATTCIGPYITVYHGINYSDYFFGSYVGPSQTWCAARNYEHGDTWYTINVANVGSNWSGGAIGSIKMINWPLNTVIQYHSGINYAGVGLKTVFNDGTTTELIPNVWNYNTPYDEIGSFSGLSP